MSGADAYIGFAQRSGRLVSGETASLIALRKGKPKLLLVAENASENTKDRFRTLAEGRGVPVVEYGTTESLGRVIGKSPRATLVIQDARLAREIQRCLGKKN